MLLWSGASPQSVSSKQTVNASEISGMRRQQRGTGGGAQTLIQPSVGHTGPVFEFLIKSCSGDHCWITASQTSAVTWLWIIYLLIQLNACIHLPFTPEPICVCVCALVSIENKTLQSRATTTTKWSAGLRNCCVTQIELDGIARTQTHTHTQWGQIHLLQQWVAIFLQPFTSSEFDTAET